MSGSKLASEMPDYSDDTSWVIPEQAPIDVFAEDDGAVVIRQFQWREGEVLISFRPEFAFALCRAILEAADFDPAFVLREAPKDDGARERQRRHRQKLRDSHGEDNVTVTAKVANDIDETHQEMGSATTS